MKNIILLSIIIFSFSILNSNLCESENFALQRAGMLQGYSNSIDPSFSNNYELKVFLGYELAIDNISSEQFILSTGFYEFDELSVNVEDDIIEYSCLFLQNHPNPFNPETKISFSILNDSNVELSVYNIKGQKVRTLIKDYLEKGIHEIIWNSKDDNNRSVTSGVYFYQFKVNSKTKAVKKCLLLK